MAPRGTYAELRVEVPGIESAVRAQVQTPEDWVTAEDWRTSWAPPFDVVRGEAYRSEALLALVGSDSGQASVRPVELQLIRESDNSYDGNAVRVETGGVLVGYIARELAALVSPTFDAAGAVSCRYPGVIVGGFSWQSARQVYIWLDRRLGDGPDLAIPPELVFAIPVWPPDAAAEDPKWPTTEQFYAVDNAIESAWSDRDLNRVAELVKQCVEMLPAFVAEAKAQRESATAQLRALAREPGLPEDFWSVMVEGTDADSLLRHLNAIDYGGQVLAAIGDRAGLEELRSAIAAEPELAELLPAADQQLGVLDLIEQILAWVAAHPGAIQKDLHTVIPADKEAIRLACYLADMGGRLKRSKRGSSYELQVVN
jgi:hypothetical protein